MSTDSSKPMSSNNCTPEIQNGDHSEEDETLQELHRTMKFQQVLTTDEESDTSSESSANIITDTAGTVGEIRGLFSPKNQAADQESEKASHMIASGKGSCKSAKHDPSECNSADLCNQADTSKQTMDYHVQTPESRGDKKRKLVDQSGSSASDNSPNPPQLHLHRRR